MPIGPDPDSLSFEFMNEPEPEPVPFDMLHAHAESLRRVARTMVRGDRVDDVVQQAWLTALRMPPYRAQNLGSWLVRVVRSAAARHHESEARYRRAASETHREDLAPSTDDLAQEVELQHRLTGAVLGLEESLRDVLLLKFYAGLGTRDIARHLGIAPWDVNRRASRAIECLRARLDREYREGRMGWAIVTARWLDRSRPQDLPAPAPVPAASAKMPPVRIGQWLVLAGALSGAAILAVALSRSRTGAPPARKIDVAAAQVPAPVPLVAGEPHRDTVEPAAAATADGVAPPREAPVAAASEIRSELPRLLRELLDRVRQPPEEVDGKSMTTALTRVISAACREGLADQALTAPAQGIWNSVCSGQVSVTFRREFRDGVLRDHISLEAIGDGIEMPLPFVWSASKANLHLLHEQDGEISVTGIVMAQRAATPKAVEEIHARGGSILAGYSLELTPGRLALQSERWCSEAGSSLVSLKLEKPKTLIESGLDRHAIDAVSDEVDRCLRELATRLVDSSIGKPNPRLAELLGQLASVKAERDLDPVSIVQLGSELSSLKDRPRSEVTSHDMQVRQVATAAGEPPVTYRYDDDERGERTLEIWINQRSSTGGGVEGPTIDLSVKMIGGQVGCVGHVLFAGDSGPNYAWRLTDDGKLLVIPPGARAISIAALWDSSGPGRPTRLPANPLQPIWTGLKQAFPD